MASLSTILRVKDNSTGEWIEIPALKGNDGKDAYLYAVENGYTGTESEFGVALGNVGEYATKTEVAAEAATRAEEDKKLSDAIEALKTEVGDDVAEKLETVEKEIEDLNTDIESIEDELEKKANSEEVYTKTEVDSKLSSVYKYQGSVADFDSLPTENLIAGDVYNTEATGDNYAWTGTEWDKLAGLVDLSEYAKTADVTSAIESAVETEATARAAADAVLQAAIDKATTDAITVHNDLTGRDTADCHPIGAITGLTEALESINTELEESVGSAVEKLEEDLAEIQKDLDAAEEKITTLETEMDTVESKVSTLETEMDAVESKVSTLETEMDAVEGRLDAVETDVSDLKDNTYTKTEIDGIVASVYKYKGSVANFDSLPTEDLVIGDVYNTEATGDNYAWTGTEWDKLAGVIDLSEYAKTTEVTSAVETEATARAAADAVLQAAIDTIELTPGADGKSGVYVGSEEPTSDEVTVWINPEGIVSVDMFTSLQNQIDALETRIAELEK